MLAISPGSSVGMGLGADAAVISPGVLKADAATLQTFLAQLTKNPSCHVFVSKGSSSSSGGFADGSFCWLVLRDVEGVNAAMLSGGRPGLSAQLVTPALVTQLMAPIPGNDGNKQLANDDLLQDTASYLGQALKVMPTIQGAIDAINAKLVATGTPPVTSAPASFSKKASIVGGAVAVLLGAGILVAKRRR